MYQILSVVLAQADAWVTLPSGLQYSVLTRGSGRAAGSSHDITFDYVGTLPGGSVFDSPRDAGAEWTTSRFAPRPVAEALTHMREGDRYKWRVPSHLGFGDKGFQGQRMSVDVSLPDSELSVSRCL